MDPSSGDHEIYGEGLAGLIVEDEGKETEHTIDETRGSSGFGFSIKSYIAMMTDNKQYILQPASTPGSSRRSG